MVDGRVGTESTWGMGGGRVGAESTWWMGGTKGVG